MSMQAFLYSADAPDRTLALAEIRVDALAASQLLWIDLESPSEQESREVAAAIGMDPKLLMIEKDDAIRPSLSNYGDRFRVTATSVVFVRSQAPLTRNNLTLVAGSNLVVSVHATKVEFLEELRNREQGESAIGALLAESFTASLLDWLLGSYFRVVEALVEEVDAVEVAILGKKRTGQNLGALVQARKRIAELRQLLKSHRDVFYGLDRPDFMATERPEAKPHFEALIRRYDRAVDELESARNLVVGSFELLSTRAAQATNETMRKLTFVTVLMGVLALVAGVMGMNFHPGFFDSGLLGFLVVIGSMLAISVLSVWIAIRRSWI